MNRVWAATVTGCVAGMLAFAPAHAQPAQAPEIPNVGGNIDDYGQWRSPYFFFRMDRSTQMEMPALDVATAIADSDRALLVVNFYYDGGRYSNYQQALLRRILYYISSKLPKVEVRLLEVMVASSDGRPVYDQELLKYYPSNMLGSYGATIGGQPVMPYGQVYLAGKLVYDFSVMREARDDDQVMENARAVQSSMLRIAAEAGSMELPAPTPPEPDVREPDLPPERFVDAPGSQQKAPPAPPRQPVQQPPARVMKEAPPLPPSPPAATVKPAPAKPVEPPPVLKETAPLAPSAPAAEAAPTPEPRSTVSAAEAEALRRARVKYLESNPPPTPPAAETPSGTVPAAEAPLEPDPATPTPSAAQAPAAPPSPEIVPEPAKAAEPMSAPPELATPPAAPESAATPAVPEAAASAPAEVAPPRAPTPQDEELRRARERYLQERPAPVPLAEPAPAPETQPQPEPAPVPAAPEAAPATPLPEARPEPAQAEPPAAPGAEAPPAPAPEPVPATAPPVAAEAAPEPAPDTPAPAAAKLNVPVIQPESHRATASQPSVTDEAVAAPAGQVPETLEATPADVEGHALMAPVDNEPAIPDDAVTSPDGLPADQLGQ